MEESKPPLLARLSHIQVELKVPKGQRNNFGNYNYRNAEDILEAVKPLLSKYNLCLTLSDELILVGERYYVRASAAIQDFSDPMTFTTVYGFAREEEAKKGMDGSQITGAASSYARKYALNGLFLIDDTKDSDTTNDSTLSKYIPKPKLAPGDMLITSDMYANLLAQLKAVGITEKQDALSVLTALSTNKYQCKPSMLTQNQAQELGKAIVAYDNEGLKKLIVEPFV